MHRNMYESIKAAVTARQAAESFGLTVNRSGMTTCPFHEDHTPSLKLDQRYYCFGCGATGDVIDFTARLLGISNHDAVQTLAERFGINPESQSVITPKIKPAASLRSMRSCCDFGRNTMRPGHRQNSFTIDSWKGASRKASSLI